MTVAITRTELAAAELRVAATRSKDVAASRRMLALALVMEGYGRSEAASAAGMDRQTLRDWVHRYNEGGLAGAVLCYRNGPFVSFASSAGSCARRVRKRTATESPTVPCHNPEQGYRGTPAPAVRAARSFLRR